MLPFLAFTSTRAVDSVSLDLVQCVLFSSFLPPPFLCWLCRAHKANELDYFLGHASLRKLYIPGVQDLLEGLERATAKGIEQSGFWFPS